MSVLPDVAGGAAFYLRGMMETSKGSTSCGWRIFKATGAGLCFLLAALAVAGVYAGLSDGLTQPRPLDPPLVGTTMVIGLVIVVGAAVSVVFGLRLASDFLPGRGVASRPLRYLLNAVMIPVLAATAIPLLPVVSVAWAVMAIAGPVVDWLLARKCPACTMARRGAIGLDPVFCEPHDRFFGGDAYRVLLSRDVD